MKKNFFGKSLTENAKIKEAIVFLTLLNAKIKTGTILSLRKS